VAGERCYQTIINETLRRVIETASNVGLVSTRHLRRIIREELAHNS